MGARWLLLVVISRFLVPPLGCLGLGSGSSSAVVTRVYSASAESEALLQHVRGGDSSNKQHPLHNPPGIIPAVSCLFSDSELKDAAPKRVIFVLNNARLP